MGVKFEGVDVLNALEQIMELHTQHYKDDFDLDKELIQTLACSTDEEKRYLLWMSRPCGTYCLWERNVYLEGSHENKVWLFYHEQTNDPILAYAVKLDGIVDGKVTGSIVPLDYPSHVERVKQLSCPVAQVTVRFKDDTEFTMPYSTRRQRINELMPEHGAPQTMSYAPESERELAVILRRERFKRNYHAKTGNIQEYIAGLQKGSMRSQLKNTQLQDAPHKNSCQAKGPEL